MLAIILCLAACVCFIFALACFSSSEDFPGIIATIFGLALIAGLCILAIYSEGRPRAANDVDCEVVQEVISSFEREDRAYAVTRNWGSRDDPIMFELASPLPPDTTCVVFREKAGDNDATVIVNEIITCPDIRSLPAEAPPETER